MRETRYGLRVDLPLPYDTALQRATEALKQEGFGVLTTIDVKQTLQQKLGHDFRRYVILGACNPVLADRALQADLDIGLLLPCNVIVYATDQPDRSVVAALDPVRQLGVAGNDALVPLALEVRSRLERVVRRVAGQVPVTPLAKEL